MITPIIIEYVIMYLVLGFALMMMENARDNFRCLSPPQPSIILLWPIMIILQIFMVVYYIIRGEDDE